MSIIIFIVIILVLVTVHEYGHFIAAKKSGMRVDEFGIGFPPRLFQKKKGETVYSINAIPFGGFVKIYGENGEEDGTSPDKDRIFSARPKRYQALVLVMGVVFNILFAWFLFSFGFMLGAPASISSMPGKEIDNPRLVVTSILPESPLSESGLPVGSEITFLSSSVSSIKPETPEDIQSFVLESQSNPITISYIDEQQEKQITVTPEKVDGTYRIGVALDVIGFVKFGPIKAIIEGAKTTVMISGNMVVSFVSLIKDAFSGDADVSSLSGPVGIAGVIKDASNFGFTSIIFFAGFISINLAILNLIPFPALDGGRLLFLLIEVIKGSPLPRNFSIWANTIGFVLLIILMIVVTYNDIVKLF